MIYQDKCIEGMAKIMKRKTMDCHELRACHEVLDAFEETVKARTRVQTLLEILECKTYLYPEIDQKYGVITPYDANKQLTSALPDFKKHVSKEDIEFELKEIDAKIIRFDGRDAPDSLLDKGTVLAKMISFLSE